MPRLPQLFLIFITVGLLAVAITAISRSQKHSPTRRMELEQKERDALSLREKVELAKLKGQKNVDASPVVTLYPRAQTVDEIDRLFSSYSAIIAEVVDERSYLSDFQVIKSWYKFKIIDALIQSPHQRSFAERQIPTDLLPVNTDEFLLPLEGGKVVIDGVEVTQRDQSTPQIDKAKRYLLLVSFDPSSRIAEPSLGGQSILPVNKDNSLDSKSDQHILQQTIKKFHHSSLDQLKRNKQK